MGGFAEVVLLNEFLRDIRELDAHFVSFDLKNFYLQTPMERSEYVRIKLSDIPQEFIEEYNLSKAAQNGWIYFDILCDSAV